MPLTINTLHPNSIIHIPHTVLCTFTKIRTRRICLIIISLFSWWSFSFILVTLLCVILDWYCLEKLDANYYSWNQRIINLRQLWGSQKILRFFLFMLTNQSYFCICQNVSFQLSWSEADLIFTSLLFLKETSCFWTTHLKKSYLMWCDCSNTR